MRAHHPNMEETPTTNLNLLHGIQGCSHVQLISKAVQHNLMSPLQTHIRTTGKFQTTTASEVCRCNPNVVHVCSRTPCGLTPVATSMLYNVKSHVNESVAPFRQPQQSQHAHCHSQTLCGRLPGRCLPGSTGALPALGCPGP